MIRGIVRIAPDRLIWLGPLGTKTTTDAFGSHPLEHMSHPESRAGGKKRSEVTSHRWATNVQAWNVHPISPQIPAILLQYYPLMEANRKELGRLRPLAVKCDSFLFSPSLKPWKKALSYGVASVGGGRLGSALAVTGNECHSSRRRLLQSIRRDTSSVHWAGWVCGTSWVCSAKRGGSARRTTSSKRDGSLDAHGLAGCDAHGMCFPRKNL